MFSRYCDLRISFEILLFPSVEVDCINSFSIFPYMTLVARISQLHCWVTVCFNNLTWLVANLPFPFGSSLSGRSMDDFLFPPIRLPLNQLVRKCVSAFSLSFTIETNSASMPSFVKFSLLTSPWSVLEIYVHVRLKLCLNKSRFHISLSLLAWSDLSRRYKWILNSTLEVHFLCRDNIRP